MNCCFLHIEFTDGSNPYFKQGTTEDIKRELYKWIVNYKLKINPVHARKDDITSPIVGHFAIATRKTDIIKEHEKYIDNCLREEFGEEIPIF